MVANIENNENFVLYVSQFNETLQVFKASIGSGIIAKLITHPLDTVRVRWQAGESILVKDKFHPLHQRIHLNARLLYQGLPFTTVCIIPGLSVFFGIYEALKKMIFRNYLDESNTKDAVICHLTSSAVGEVISDFFWTPMEVVKQHLQVRPLKTSTLVGASLDTTPLAEKAIRLTELIRLLYKENGIKAFYRGYLVTLFAYVPQTSVYLMFFDGLNSHWKRQNSHMDISFLVALQNATISSILCNVLTSPFDWIKTRWQLVHTNRTSKIRIDLSYSKFVNFMTFSKNLLVTNGMSGLLKNAVARTVCNSPAIIITMTSYEYLLARLLKTTTTSE